MATITLKISKVTSEMKFDNKIAKDICDGAWSAYHRKDEEATEQEKLDWVTETILTKALERASAKKDSIEEHEKRKAEHEARREERRNTPKLK